MKNSVGKFLFLLLVSSFLIFSCNENFSDRIQLDSGWKYSLENPDLEEVELYLLNDVDLKNLQNLLPTREGTIYLTKTFILPSQLQKEDVSCYLGRISYSDRTYLNHYLIGSTGYDEDRRYSSGTEPRYYEIPEELLNPGVNTITIEIYVRNKGYLRSNAFIGLHDVAKNAWISDCFWSCHIYLVFGFVLLLAGIYCFKVFFNINQKKDVLYYSVLCCLSVINLSLYYITEIPFLSFYKLYYGIFNKITACFIPANILVVFTLFLDEFFERKCSRLHFILRCVILVVPQIIYCFIPERFCYGFVSYIPYIAFLPGVVHILFVLIWELNNGKKNSFKLTLCVSPVVLCILFDSFVHAGLNINYLPYVSLWGWPISLFAVMFLISKKKIVELQEEVSKAVVVVHPSQQEPSYDSQIVMMPPQAALPLKKNLTLRQSPVLDNYEIAYCFKPFKNQAEDMYDFFTEENHLQGLALFETSGDSESLSHVTTLAKQVVVEKFVEGRMTPLTKIMHNINECILQEKGSAHNSLTGILIRVFDNRIEYVNVGHSPAFFRNGKGTKCMAIQIDSDNYAEQTEGEIGSKEITSDYKGIGFTVAAGDAVIFYSKAFETTANNQGEPFGQDRIRQAFLQSTGETAEAKLRYILDMFENYTQDNPVNQDLTVIVLQKK